MGDNKNCECQPMDDPCLSQGFGSAKGPSCSPKALCGSQASFKQWSDFSKSHPKAAYAKVYAARAKESKVKSAAWLKRQDALAKAAKSIDFDAAKDIASRKSCQQIAKLIQYKREAIAEHADERLAQLSKQE